jgi:hypothetical protein
VLGVPGRAGSLQARTAVQAEGSREEAEGGCEKAGCGVAKTACPGVLALSSLCAATRGEGRRRVAAAAAAVAPPSKNCIKGRHLARIQGTAAASCTGRRANQQNATTCPINKAAAATGGSPTHSAADKLSPRPLRKLPRWQHACTTQHSTAYTHTRMQARQ